METPSPYTIIVQIFNFLILVVVLRYVLYKPLIEVMRTREETVRDKLDEADSINAEALNFKELYEQKLSDAKKEASALITGASTEGERIRSELIQEGRKEARHIHDKAMEELEREREKVAQTLRKEVAALSVSLAERLLKDTFDADTHARFTSDFLRKAEEHAL